jgi:hypothetical protein
LILELVVLKKVASEYLALAALVVDTLCGFFGAMSWMGSEVLPTFGV